jgi:hypothetical protein
MQIVELTELNRQDAFQGTELRLDTYRAILKSCLIVMDAIDPNSQANGEFKQCHQVFAHDGFWKTFGVQKAGMSYDVAKGYGMPRAEACVCGFLYDIKWDQIRETIDNDDGTVDKSDMMPRELKKLEDEKAMQDNAKEKEERQDKESATLQPKSKKSGRKKSTEESEEEFKAKMEEKKKARKEAAEASARMVAADAETAEAINDTLKQDSAEARLTIGDLKRKEMRKTFKSVWSCLEKVNSFDSASDHEAATQALEEIGCDE